MEGRDIGTVVFPNADVKIFLDADQGIRAERRIAQTNAHGVGNPIILGFPEVIHQQISGYRGHPRIEGSLFCVEAGQGSVDLYEHFLGQVFGVFAPTSEPIADVINAPVKPLNDFFP